ncbi:MAG: molybdopterin-dependent oxidoreductase [Pseudomonadota bacterium]
MTTCTTCPYCGVGCGVLATADGAVGAEIKGDPNHPANFGRLCSKGSALGETISLDGRLLQPRIGGEDVGWDTAIGAVATAFSDAIRDHGPDSVAIYGSGQLLTEDYYVANKFMKGFVGSANIDTNSRLCMASTVAGHKRAFGSDTVPGTYEDLEEADLVVLVGSNLAWCHPVLYQRLAAAKAARPDMRIINIDPRRTATSDLVDLHLALAPGTDVTLFNGLLTAIMERGATNTAYVADHIDGLAEAVRTAQTSDLSDTGLDMREIAAFFDLWIGTKKVVTVFSQGVNQSAAGVDKVNAIINCHLATGRIGRPGMGPFSVTGQPNAMGGREVGGLSNMLACHLSLEDADHRAAVQAHWASPAIASKPGLKAVDLFRACANGRIKALWVMSTNPAVSMPDADAVRDAIRSVPFVAISDMFGDTDTAKLAQVLLPAAGWGEKSGTVTNSDRTISRQRSFIPAPGAARPDWRIISDVATAMGWAEAFAYERPADIFREHAALSGIAADLGVDFDISGLTGLTDDEYDTLAPVRWPVSAGRRGGRFFAEGGFFTSNKRGKMIAVEARMLAAPITPARPFRLNTGRVRDHWHTMTRTARAARLSQHIAEPYVEMHADDAAKAGLCPAVLARVTTDHGEAVLRVMISGRLRRGEVFVPMHWTARFASAGRIGAAIPGVVDPISGQPELKGAVCAIQPLQPRWYGFALGHGPLPEALPTDYWALATTKTGWRAELAAHTDPEDWSDLAQEICGGRGDPITLLDAARGIVRIAFVEDGVVTGALFTAREPVALGRAHAVEIFDAEPDVNTLLAGVPRTGQTDPGATICACFSIGVNTITSAIFEQGLVSVDEVGAALSAGTNCGSCRPELESLLRATRDRDPAPIAAE